MLKSVEHTVKFTVFPSPLYESPGTADRFWICCAEFQAEQESINYFKISCPGGCNKCKKLKKLIVITAKLIVLFLVVLNESLKQTDHVWICYAEFHAEQESIKIFKILCPGDKNKYKKLKKLIGHWKKDKVFFHPC